MRCAAGVVAAVVGSAVAVNVVVHLLGRAAGGTFAFVREGVVVEVDTATVAGFTAVPLLVGLVLVAVLGPRWPRSYGPALVVAPLLALVTIASMTIPAGFDAVSTLTLAACHLTLVPLSVVGVLGLRRAAARTRAVAGSVA